jgi:integrase
VLSPWLRDDPDAYLFQPRESMLARQRTAGAAGTHYSPTSYGNLIALACKKAGVPPFAPNRLRHACATRYDHAAGLEVASTILGHSDPAVTLIYAEKDLARAAEWVARLG